MKDYYLELIKYSPNPITLTNRDELQQIWTNEEYPCLSAFLDFYECFQKAQDVRHAFLEFFPFEDIRIEDGGLIFARGHQNVCLVGIELSDLIYENPRVKYQRTKNGTWFNESGSLRSFLFNTVGWQILNLMESVVSIKVDDAEIEKMVGHILFCFTTDRSVTKGSRYSLYQNKEKNILACYDEMDEKLYLAAASDGILDNFEEKYNLQFNWL